MALMPRIVAEFTQEELLDAYRSFEAYCNEHGCSDMPSRSKAQLFSHRVWASPEYMATGRSG